MENDQNGDIFFLCSALSSVSHTYTKMLVIVCTFDNKVSTSLKQVLVHGIGLCVVLWMEFEQPCSFFFIIHCFVSKQVTSVTALWICNQVQRNVGKPQEKTSCHLSRLVKVKLGSGGKHGIIYLAKRMKFKK